MLSREAFTAIVALVALQRLWETRHSRAHERALLRDHAVEHAPAQMPFMVALHALWLVAMLVEVWLFGAEAGSAVTLLALCAFAAGQTLRLLAMRALGERWTVSVVTPTDGRPPVSHGIYRYLRHPNYLGVMLELAALPLLHGAYVTALVFSAANGVLLTLRIRAEEAALERFSPYREALGDRPRFVPLGRRR